MVLEPHGRTRRAQLRRAWLLLSRPRHLAGRRWRVPKLARLLLHYFPVELTSSRVEGAMDTNIDAGQIEHVLSHLARLRQRRDQEDVDVLESLRPAWLGLDAWDIVLEDLRGQRYRERARVVRLRLVGG